MPARPNHLRHFINYHNPDTMGTEFGTIGIFAIATNKFVRDLTGDVVWMVGRKSGIKKRYYLYGRFRVTEVEDSLGEEGDWEGEEDFRYSVSGEKGYWFRPAVPLNDLPWFAELFRITAQFSTGFQCIESESVLKGLQECYGNSSSRAIVIVKPH